LLKSMTAFGKGVCENEAGRFTVEIQTLNRKFLEINFNFPKEYALVEPDVRKVISKCIRRGKANTYLSVDLYAAQNSLLRVNVDMARQLVDAYRKLKDQLGLAGDVDVALLAQNRDIVKLDEELLASEQYQNGVITAVKKSLEGVESMRIAEGREIEKDFRTRLKEIESKIDEIDKQGDNAPNRYRDRLIERVKMVVEQKENLDERIMQEIAIFSEKIDISEELLRLRSHIKQFFSFIDSKDAVGRSLEFLLQEMNREVNTIGSKSAEADISRLIVELKSELEKIREQVQNVE